ncbi:MAG TPA: acyl-CoA dehydrogenase family protein [Blastocatellia bacterium]|jgi:alkylation response protein AidB-like acyl-CoA dehydrogenase
MTIAAPNIYGLDQTALDVAATTASIARDVALPSAAEVDAEARFPQESLAALARGGLLGLTVPKEFGGKGQGPRAFAAAVEELAQGCTSAAMIYVMHISAAQALIASTELARREEILRDVAAGRHLTTLAFSEKGSRSQFWAPISKLEISNGGYKTTAMKSWVTSAGHADSYVSSAQNAGASSPLESTIYLVRKNAEGVRLVSSFNGIGLRGNDSAPVALENLSVSKDDLISQPGAGAQMMLEVILPWFCVGTAAMANGLCRAAVAATSEHLSTAAFEHTNSRLRELPNLRARLAEMSLRTEQSRALLGYTLNEMENPTAMTPLYVLQSRLGAIEAAVDVTDLAMKTCGGAAFSRHLGIERLFRDARAGWVMAPTADHLQDFIGKALTGLPLF